MSRKYCPKFVTSLEPNQVFVFGSNEDGFHGAGSAGFAQRGTAKNTWRQDNTFLKAMKAPLGHESRIGMWSILGQGRGYQKGRKGASYGIATVTRAGRKRSIPLSKILFQLQELGEFARQHPEKEFLVGIAGGGYNGWTVEEIQKVYNRWFEKDCPPDNVIIPKTYERRP